jgi:hypothetical protein
MKNKKISVFSLFFLSSLILFSLAFSLAAQRAFAASTVMSVNPNSGSYTIGSMNHIDLIIDGHGDIFNAAKATLTLSGNLSVSDLTLGDCNFSFVQTPSTADPSFTGVMLGGTSQKCTVFTLTVLPTATGNGTITLSNASVKAYKTAQDTLISLQNGTYTITPSSSGTTSITISPAMPQTSQQATVTSDPNSPYTMTLKVVNADNTPLVGAVISLDPSGSPQKTTQNTTAPTQTVTTDKNGYAQFTGLSKGLHTVVVKDANGQVAKNIFNVNGANHDLVLGMKTQKQPRNLTLIILGIILVLGILMFILIRYTALIKFVGKGKSTGTTT